MVNINVQLLAAFGFQEIMAVIDPALWVPKQMVFVFPLSSKVLLGERVHL